LKTLEVVPAQRELFPASEVAEWRPPKKPKRFGPSDLLARIRSMAARPAGCFCSVAYFAAQFKKSRATIARWISQLKGAGLIRVIRRGPTSARYEVIPQNEMSSAARPCIIPSGFISTKTPSPKPPSPEAEARDAAAWEERQRLDRAIELYRRTGRAVDWRTA